MDFREPVVICQVSEDGAIIEISSTLGPAVGELAGRIRAHPGEPSPPFIRHQGRILSPGNILALEGRPDFPSEFRRTV
jgi:hypothetical protein